jgi:hypothetical protein
MSALRLSVALVAWLAVTSSGSAQDKKGPAVEATLATASGVVDKANKDAVVVKPRGADGKFQKAITLHVTGTSKVTVLTPRRRGTGTVIAQRDAGAADLVAGQAVAVIYAEVGKDRAVLLSAVAQPAAGK